MSFCSLFMSFQALSLPSCSFVISFYQLIFGPLSPFLPPPRFSSASLLFVWQQCLTFQMFIQYSSSLSIPVNIFHIRDKHVIGLKLVTSFAFSLSFMIGMALPVMSHSHVSSISKYNCNCAAILSCKI